MKASDDIQEGLAQGSPTDLDAVRPQDGAHRADQESRERIGIGGSSLSPGAAVVTKAPGIVDEHFARAVEQKL
ncbi:MAG TPA: hypothetical protein VJT49_05675 [Amycolatopsis sp.]|uniref:hypothetical protein n=1 Tax=Amycolatopsis sp. TaxID=37632 RepID=UPI002B49A0E2|nr:hypothetical protein [Amycolatopsis sp.]HKS44595.1 hypothetical protein [Amycolatopsis sp.]